MAIELMTPEEIHAFGVNVALEQLPQKGHTVVKAQHRIHTDPQIITRGQQGHLCFVLVRTGVYPTVGELDPKTQFRHFEHAMGLGALPAFIGIGIANADGTDTAGKSLPLRGAQFRVHFGGLLLIAGPGAYSGLSSSSVPTSLPH